jgi:hypothetical protein
MIRNPSIVRILLGGLLLGASVDLLFYGKALGISFPIWVLGLLAVLFWLSRGEDVVPAWSNLWIVAPLIFYAVMVCVRASPTLTALNVVTSLALLGLIAFYFAGDRLADLPLLGFPLVWLYTGLAAAARPVSLVRDGFDPAALREHGGRKLAPVLRGLALALPIVAVFAMLLASADLVFDNYLVRLFSLDILEDLPEYIVRAVIVLIAAWLISGALAVALHRGHRAEGIADRLNGLRRGWLGPVETQTVMIAVNLLFLAFVVIQFAYLFGGERNIAGGGAVAIESFTYAQYARRGFFELVTVAVLTLGLLLSLERLTRLESPADRTRFKALGTGLMACVLVILASAFQRLSLYEAAYGYTELRLYSHAFMLMLGAVCGWFIVTLWVRPDRFAIGVVVCALGLVIGLDLVNPDAFIARQNLARYAATGDIDLAYLSRLSADAVPVLVEARPVLAPSERAWMVPWYSTLPSRVSDSGGGAWQSLHLAWYRAEQSIERAGGLP